MNREALAYLRMLPAGAADVGVSREELRAAGAGDWSMVNVARDDLAADLPDACVDPLADYDAPVRLDDDAPRPGERVLVVSFGGRATGT
jgi:hypothetical protein